MRVLVDTCIWSSAFRYKNPILLHEEKLRQLIIDDRAMIIGPIRQEFLSGISDINKHVRMKSILRSFQDLPMKTEIFELAAEMDNSCRRVGVTGSSVDFMICAASKYYNLEIWTVDPDFVRYKPIVGIDLMV